MTPNTAAHTATRCYINIRGFADASCNHPRRCYSAIKMARKCACDTSGAHSERTCSLRVHVNLSARSSPHERLKRNASAARVTGSWGCAQRDGAYDKAVVVHVSGRGKVRGKGWERGGNGGGGGGGALVFIAQG